MNPNTRRDVVLVVDDSPETLSMLNDTLDQAGITVLVALEGSQALNIANSITPDIILLDAMMPNMDGFETCRHLKANRKLAHIPVIFMTGLSDSEHIVKGLETGGVDYITKPVDPDVLLARIQVHLTNARQTQSAHAALDTAGQYLFAASDSGELLWATPQAYRLFDKAGLTTEWFANGLQHTVQTLLAPHFNRDKGVLVNENGNSVEIRYMSQTGGQEYLLQLRDLDRPDDIEILRNAFPQTTNREAEVLLWIARGKTNKEIGTILDLSPRTVNKHLEQVFRKLSVENRTSAAVLALRHLDLN